ncbi:MAG: VWA domain-containing protein [Acidobacteria bacterium]|nr:VWA domain-containing protein [Acidobacteriota bacterium]
MRSRQTIAAAFCCSIFLVLALVTSYAQTSVQSSNKLQAGPEGLNIAPSAAATTDMAEAATNTFSSRVREVSVLFSASDWRGHFVSNLTEKDVRVSDNGLHPGSLTYFLREEDLALRVAVLIDVSGSVSSSLKAEQRAAATFLRETLRPSDSAALMVFGDKLHMIQDFTTNLTLLEKDVHHLAASQTSTAIYDALTNSCKQMAFANETGPTRHALILITDGEDNASHATITDAINAALNAEVVIFALNIFPYTATDAPLAKLAESTGGSLLHASGASGLKAAFRKINSQLRNQYLLGYKPPVWQADGSFHRIRVSTDRFGLHIHCRKGYYAAQ